MNHNKVIVKAIMVSRRDFGVEVRRIAGRKEGRKEVVLHTV
jgi:hypothetical protein